MSSSWPPRAEFQGVTGQLNLLVCPDEDPPEKEVWSAHSLEGSAEVSLPAGRYYAWAQWKSNINHRGAEIWQAAKLGANSPTVATYIGDKDGDLTGSVGTVRFFTS